VQKVGTALRLSLNLVDARTLRQLGSAVLDEPGGDWLRLQDKAVKDLTALLSVRGAEEALKPGEPIQPEVYESYLRALGLLQRWDRSGNLKESAQTLEGVVSRAPRFVPGHVALATAYWTLYTQENDPNWVEKARVQVAEAHKLDRKSAAVHEIMGRIRASAGQRDLAVLEFQEALKIDPRSQVAISGMARAYEAMGRKEEAEASYKRVVELRPQWWNGYNGLGTYYYRQRRFAEAETQFRKALELTPDNPGMLSNLGNALKNQGRIREALAMFEKAIAVEPNYVAYQNAGTLYFQQNDFAKSAQMFERALLFNAKDYRVWGSVGQALSRSGGSVERRKEALGKAVSLGENLLVSTPANAETRSLLAVYYRLLGNPAKAREHLAAIAPGSTEDTDVWVRVASGWMSLGDKQEAERAVRLAASLGATRETFAREPELKPFLDQLPKQDRKQNGEER
jgi:serine/threonine-protein kinase